MRIRIGPPGAAMFAASSPEENDVRKIIEEASVWNVVGDQPPGIFFRFGDAADQAMFVTMRVVAIVDAVWVPFLVSFGQLAWLRTLTFHPVVLFADVMFSALYALGVLMQLRTSIVSLESAQEYLDPRKIAAIRFSSTTFWCDFISMFGTFWWHPGFPAWIASLRIVRAWRLTERADDLYELHLAVLSSDNWVHNFAKLVFQLAVVIHNFGCAWFFAATMSTESWEHHMEHDPEFLDFEFRSLYVCYFADGARMLAGWGGPPGLSPDGVLSFSERIASSLLAPIASIYTATVFGQIAEVIQLASQATAVYLEKLAKLSSELEAAKVSADVKQRCLQYLSFMNINNGNKRELDELFKDLSLDLKQDLKLHLFDDLARKAPFLKAIPEDMMPQIVLAFEDVVFGPGEIIFNKGEFGDAVFFVMRGSVEVVNDGVIVFVMHPGQYFGEIALVCEAQRTATVRAQTFAMCAKLTRDVFQELLECDPTVKEFIMLQIANRTQKQAPCEAAPPLSDGGADAATAPRPLRASEAQRLKSSKRRASEVFSPEKAIDSNMQRAASEVQTLCSNLARMNEQFDATERRLSFLEVRLAEAATRSQGRPLLRGRGVPAG